MIDTISLLIGAGLGAALALFTEVVIDATRKRRDRFLTLDEVHQQINAETEQRIEKWRDRKAETDRLSGRGAA